MIDMHSHVIYDIDDGPTNIETSLDILKSAKINGIEKIFLTSHYIEDGYKASGEKYLERFKKIEEAISNEKIGIKIYYGNEIMIYPELANDLNSGKFMTLNDSRYVLIELPLTEKVLYLENVIFQVISKGYIPIIAHPERYMYFQNNTDYFFDLLNMGALFQINGGSVVGIYGKGAEKAAKYLLENHMVQFIGSDSHSPNRIFSYYPEIVWQIKKITGEEYFYNLTTKNPTDVINNVEIKYESCYAPKRRRWFW